MRNMGKKRKGGRKRKKPRRLDGIKRAPVYRIDFICENFARRVILTLSVNSNNGQDTLAAQTL